MLKSNESHIAINDLGIAKIGHLHENIKFDCDDNIENISADFRDAYLEIIKSAASGNYDALNQLIDNTFNSDIEVLEIKLKDSKNIGLEDKKKFFFNEEEGKIINDFRNYIKIIYMERILFDFLNIGLTDLDNHEVEEILKGKQNARIGNFINSVLSDENNNAMLNNNFKTDYAKCVADKNNFLRYMIYFRYLKENLPHIAEEIKKLKSYCYTEDEISKNDDLIKQKGNKLQKLAEDINQLSKNIEAREEKLSKPDFLEKHTYEIDQTKDIRDRKKKQNAKVQVGQELERLNRVKFVLENYNNELGPAREILSDIQKNWGVALENFIFRHMLKYPSTISQLRKDYSFSMWGFVEFVLTHKDNQNFNRALYEIDKTKKWEDFQGDENRKRTEILKNAENSINSLNENQRKLVNDLFNNEYDNGLENSWMRKAFWILFAGVSSFVIVATAPFLAIIIPDIFMGLGALLATIIGVLFVIFEIGATFCGSTAGVPSLYLVCNSFKNMSWLTFKSISMPAYYASTFFSVAIPIASVILIGTIAFYIYKKHQFNSMIEVPNLQIQQEKSPLESQLEIFKNKFANSQGRMPYSEKNLVVL